MSINAIAADLFQTAVPVLPAAAVARTGEREMAPVVQPLAKTGDVKPEQVKEAVDQIQKFTQTLTQNLKFSIDEDTGKMVIKIVDAQTQEVIRQMPSEEAIKIASALGKIQGLLFNGHA